MKRSRGVFPGFETTMMFLFSACFFCLSCRTFSPPKKTAATQSAATPVPTLDKTVSSKDIPPSGGTVTHAYPTRPCEDGDLVDCALVAYEVCRAPGLDVELGIARLLGQADRDAPIVDGQYAMLNGLIWAAVAEGHLDYGRTLRADFWLDKIRTMEAPERPDYAPVGDRTASQLAELSVRRDTVLNEKAKGIPTNRLEQLDYYLNLAQKQLATGDETGVHSTLRDLSVGLHAISSTFDVELYEKRTVDILLDKNRIDLVQEALPAVDGPDPVRNCALLAEKLSERGRKEEAEKQIDALLALYQSDNPAPRFHRNTDGTAAQAVAEVRGAAAARDFVNSLEDRRRLGALARAACAVPSKQASEQLFDEVDTMVDTSPQRAGRDLLDIAEAAQRGNCPDRARHYLERLEQVLTQTHRADAGMRRAAEIWAMIGDAARGRRFMDRYLGEDDFHDEVLVSNVIVPAAFLGDFEAALQQSLGVKERTGFASAVINIALAAQKLKKKLTGAELETLRQVMDEALGIHRLYTATNRFSNDIYVARDTDNPFEGDPEAEGLTIPIYIEKSKLALSYIAKQEQMPTSMNGDIEGPALLQQQRAALRAACTRHGLTLVEVDETWDGGTETLADLTGNRLK